MDILFTYNDFFSFAPLLALLIGGLLLLLHETFIPKYAKQTAFYVAIIAVFIAICIALFSSESTQPLLTSWIVFDETARFFTVFFLSVGLVSIFLAAPFFKEFPGGESEYYFLLLMALFGLVLIGIAADFLTIFLGLETLSIALYILCGFMKKWETASESSIKYFILGSLATAFLLYGIALIYGSIGTTNLHGLSEAYQNLSQGYPQALFFGGIALITLGFAFKAAIVPFHNWAPDVYSGAPTPIVAFMAVGTKAGAFAALVRLFLIHLPNFDPYWSQIVSWMAIITMIYANTLAIKQVQLRRFFAYSSISHAGFILIPIVSGTPQALLALEYYLIVYAIATMGSFAVLASIDHHAKGSYMRDLHGLFYRSPWLTGLFTLCLLTLAGVPPTLGFFAKFYLFQAAFQAGLYSLVVTGLLTTVLAMFYYVRILSIMFSHVPEENIPNPKFFWQATVVGTVAFASIIVFSIYPEPVLQLLG